MTIKKELEQLKIEYEGSQHHIDFLQEQLSKVCEQRDSYAKTLQDVCINLSRGGNENTT